MPRDQEEQRRLWREKYARMYPAGFKRRRNAAQTALQRAAQRRYQKKEHVLLTRRLQRQVREYLVPSTLTPVAQPKAAAATPPPPPRSTDSRPDLLHHV